MMLLPTPLLLAAVVAAPSTLLPTVQSLSIKPSPPLQPPKSFSSRSGRGPATTPGWRSDTRQRHNHQPSTLHAYTVADSNKPSWLSLLKFPTFELGPRGKYVVDNATGCFGRNYYYSLLDSFLTNSFILTSTIARLSIFFRRGCDGGSSQEAIDA